MARRPTMRSSASGRGVHSCPAAASASSALVRGARPTVPLGQVETSHNFVDVAPRPTRSHPRADRSNIRRKRHLLRRARRYCQRRLSVARRLLYSALPMEPSPTELEERWECCGLPRAAADSEQRRGGRRARARVADIPDAISAQSTALRAIICHARRTGGCMVGHLPAASAHLTHARLSESLHGFRSRLSAPARFIDPPAMPPGRTRMLRADRLADCASWAAMRQGRI